MRTEKDSMGEMPVPDDALYGAQTARAMENFPISGRGLGREMIRALELEEPLDLRGQTEPGFVGSQHLKNKES